MLVHTLSKNFRKKKSYYDIECHEKIRLSTFVGAMAGSTNGDGYLVFKQENRLVGKKVRKKKKKIQNIFYDTRLDLKSSKMVLLLKMVE